MSFVVVVNYSCGGTALNRKNIQFDLDTSTSTISNLVIYEGPVGLDGMFFHIALKKIAPKNEIEIRDHIPGIKLKLKHEYNLDDVKFKF